MTDQVGSSAEKEVIIVMDTGQAGRSSEKEATNVKVTDQAGRSEEYELIKVNQPRSSKESGMIKVFLLIKIFI